MIIEKVMTSDLKFVEVPGTRNTVLEKMRETGLSGFPVVKKGTKRVVGYISRSDLLKKPNEGQISMLMTENPSTLDPTQSIEKAVKTLRTMNLRRIPIVKDNKLVGMLSVTDLISKAIPSLDLTSPIAPYVKKRVTTIWDQTPIRVAFQIMRIANKSLLPAINEAGALTGLISETELLHHAKVVREDSKSGMDTGSEGEKWAWDTTRTIYITTQKLTFPEGLLVKDIMKTDVVTVHEETPIIDCARKMNEYKMDQIPVLDASGEIIGIIIDLDLIRVLETEE